MTPPPDAVPTDAADAPNAPSREEATSRRWWALAGVLVGIAGLAVSQLVAELVSVKQTPLAAIVEAVQGFTPGASAQATVDFLATIVTPLLLVVLLLVLVAVFAVGGLLSRRAVWAGVPLWTALAAALLAAGIAIDGFGPARLLPGVAGWVVWVAAAGLLARRLHAYEDDRGRPGRRGLLLGFGAATLVTVFAGGGTWWIERRRAAVRESRRLLRIPGVTRPLVPADATLAVDGITPWQTPTDDFHVITPALRVPTLAASEWTLKIHGLVREPLVLTFDDLLERGLVEAWGTLTSVSNEVGGDLVGNAWWSGVLTRTLLEEVTVLGTADAVVQRSADGSVRVTPLSVLRDERPSMLAVAMNGEALEVEHGFPVRTVVPGHYEETTSCKWVVEWEVTTFADAELADGEERWSRRAPVRLASRIDVPADGAELPAGSVEFAGVAWQPGAGVERVEFAVDGGAWRDALVADPGIDESWVQWSGRARLSPGEHTVRVRAVNRRGETQTAVRRDPLPSGATGWHEVRFTVEEPPQG